MLGLVVLDLAPPLLGLPSLLPQQTLEGYGAALMSSVPVPGRGVVCVGGAAAPDRSLFPPSVAQGSAFESSARRELRAWV